MNSAPLRKRKRIFIGCEGKSEVGYSQWLKILCDEKNKAFHILTKDLKGGGVLSMANIAVQSYAREDNRSPIEKGFILIDRDRVESDAEERNSAIQLCNRNDIKIIWQRPNHEGFLLQHCDDYHGTIPNLSSEAETRLSQLKSGYNKPMGKYKYYSMFKYESVVHAATSNPDLRCLLASLDLIN